MANKVGRPKTLTEPNPEIASTIMPETLLNIKALAKENNESVSRTISKILESYFNSRD